MQKSVAVTAQVIQLRNSKIMKKISSMIVGAAGEHHVLSQLLRRGWIAALAPDGAPNMDILVTDKTINDFVQFKSKHVVTSVTTKGGT